MIVPLLMMVAGGYLLIKSLFFPQNGAVDVPEKGKNKTVYILSGIIILVLIAGFYLTGNKEYQPSKVTTNGADGRVTEKVDFTVMHTLLSEKNFETANIPTTYWFYDESKLTNVVSGIKGETAFEFYEYTDGETTDEVYYKILADISPDMEQSESKEYETNLQNGGKIFTLTENGRVSIVIYQGNVVIYAHSPEEEKEVQNILVELGYYNE